MMVLKLQMGKWRMLGGYNIYDDNDELLISSLFKCIYIYCPLPLVPRARALRVRRTFRIRFQCPRSVALSRQYDSHAIFRVHSFSSFFDFPRFFISSYFARERRKKSSSGAGMIVVTTSLRMRWRSPPPRTCVLLSPLAIDASSCAFVSSLARAAWRPRHSMHFVRTTIAASAGDGEAELLLLLLLPAAADAFAAALPRTHAPPDPTLPKSTAACLYLHALELRCCGGAPTPVGLAIAKQSQWVHVMSHSRHVRHSSTRRARVPDSIIAIAPPPLLLLLLLLLSLKLRRMPSTLQDSQLTVSVRRPRFRSRATSPRAPSTEGSGAALDTIAGADRAGERGLRRALGERGLCLRRVVGETECRGELPLRVRATARARHCSVSACAAFADDTPLWAYIDRDEASFAARVIDLLLVGDTAARRMIAWAVAASPPLMAQLNWAFCPTLCPV